MTDAQLLDQFTTTRSEAAFAELVSRHIGWVQASARRRLGDSGLAEDATQAVFILLAQKAPSLRRETVLSAWLFQTLRFTCLAIARSERRRKIREDEAAAMREAERSTDEVWGELSGQLDEVVAKLSGSDRRAVLLRFYESKTYGEVASVLGISEEAARKRVQRAVDKLQGMFQRRGVSLSSGAIGAAMLTHVAPGGAGVATTSVASAALSAASGSSAAVAKTAGGMIAFAQAKAAAIVVAASVAIVAAGGTAVVVATAKSVKPQAAVFAATVAATTTAPVIADSKPRFAAGQVLSPDEKPVAGARVTLVGYDEVQGFQSFASGTSDANGRFHLDIPAGKDAANVLIDAPPFAYGQMGVTEGAQEAVILSMPHTAEVTLLMPDGSPAAGVELAPLQCNGGDFWTQEFWAVEFPEEEKKKLAQRTDGQGKCRFTRMPENSNLTLDVRDERFARLTYNPYNSGVTIGKEAVAIGKPLSLEAAGSITGRVVGLDGKPASDVMVVAQETGDRGQRGAARTDARGEYRIVRLGVGEFNVIAGPADEERSTTSAWTAMAREKLEFWPSGASINGVDFQEERGTLITGKVTLNDTGMPVAGIDVSVQGPARPQGGGVDSIETRADGTYTLRVPAGQQHVYIGGPVPDGYTSPGQSARDVTTIVGKDTTVNFALARAKGKPLSGVVRHADGSPAVGAWVAAQPDEGNVMPFEGPSVRTDAEGKFLFKALTPKSLLRAKLGALATAQRVEVNGGETNLSLVVEKVMPITLKGRVVDAAGKGIAGAETSMIVMYGQFGSESSWVICDADGNYTIDHLRLGEDFTVAAHAKGYGQGQSKVNLKHGDRLVQQSPLVLKRAGSVLTGTVVNEAGEPLAGVDVNIFGEATSQQHTKTNASGGFEFADIVEGETIQVSLSKDWQFSDGGALKAGTVGAEIVFKNPNKK